jgi:hypothetical protein
MMYENGVRTLPSYERLILISLDMEEYLPPNTYQWCQDQLHQLHFDISEPPEDVKIPYRTIYLQLRTALDQHLASGDLPELGLSAKPTGALDWHPVSTENVRRVELVGDDADGAPYEEEIEE